MKHVQGLRQGTSFIGEDSVMTTAFLLYLYSSKTDALQFLKDLGLIASNITHEEWSLQPERASPPSPL
jgi:hypothetical protein